MEDWLSARTKVSPHSLALLFQGKQWTYIELNSEVNKVSKHLLSLIHPGQHVGTLLNNSPFTVILIHALARIGAVMVPLNTRLTGQELKWQIDKADCQLVIYDQSTADLANQIPTGGATLINNDSLTTNEPFDNEIAGNFNLNNLQAIVHTSGTTGKPKGAMLTFANHFWSATASAYRLGVQVDDRWLSCLPLYHVGGLAVIFRSCLSGTAVILHDQFDVKAISESLDKDGTTLVSLVPTMVHRLLDHRQGQPWPGALRHLLLGGAAASPNLLSRCREQNIPVSTTYGLTEASSQVATALSPQTYSKPGTVGRPLLFSSIQIMDDKGQPTSVGQAGEIVVSGPTIMAGFYKDPQATAVALRDGQLFTGDIGFLDEEGDLFVLQRRGDMILCGGENIYPSEIEQALAQHPGIAAVCVVGLPDEEWGQCVGAMIQAKDNVALTPQEVEAFGRTHLAGYKIPRTIKIVNQLPQTASGKIQRHMVAEALNQAGIIG